MVAPPALAQRVLAALERKASVINVIHLPGAARSPSGDVILCDIAREDASVVLAELRDLGLAEQGTIAIETVDTVDLDCRSRRRARRRRRTLRRRRLGRGREPHLRERRALGQLPRLHGARDADRRRRNPDRLGDPDHRRNGRRTRVRASSRPLRRARPPPARAGAPLARRPRRRLPGRNRLDLPRTLLLRAADRGPDELADHPATLFISHPDCSPSSSPCSPASQASSRSRPRSPAP